MANIITRRDFLKGVTVTALGLAVSDYLPAQTKKTKVVLIRHKDVLDSDSNVNPEIMKSMLDDAVMELTGTKDPVKAFQKLIKPKDIVGIKTNAWKFIPTPKELENAIQARVMDAGVKEENISIDDRSVLSNPVFLKSTALINTRPVRTHYWSGLGTCIKNYIMFDTNRPQYHPDACADLAKLWNLPIVKGKTRLNILVAMTPLFHGRGANHYDNRYVWNYNGLIVGTDPVAVDTIGLQLIKAKRLAFFGKNEEWETLPKHIELADTKHKLGTSNLKNIELVKLGWKEDILI